MGKRPITSTTPETTTTRRSPWHDVVAAQHELQQARLRVAIEDDGDIEEYL
ncbi:hypothetical protein SAMN05216184_101137 [Georgenia satyanarayanai]|uniref:Uncharacterized protein n=1 Tax=Georgenia satyanarayanai TaxID=860221 RepID=A0A2Y8ZYW7_9MICO|nr:hypothetical protein [Georgenia satyanarayanai]PYG01678.1 hypothetical protein A8987_101137 [Georgenia satyanarayanai]SSA36478.1 hypothetical protein SAMN05216184_101137 [Georgenia satyanarayanai]